MPGMRGYHQRNIQYGSKAGTPLEFDKNLYCKNAYKIIAQDMGGANYVLKIAPPVPEELDIFVDDKPELFVQWILDQLNNPVAVNLVSTKYSMYFENIVTGNRVYLVKASLTGAELSALKALKNVKAEKRLP